MSILSIQNLSKSFNVDKKTLRGMVSCKKYLQEISNYKLTGELANILNESAIIATRNKHNEISNEDIENAVKKIKKQGDFHRPVWSLFN